MEWSVLSRLKRVFRATVTLPEKKRAYPGTVFWLFGECLKTFNTEVICHLTIQEKGYQKMPLVTKLWLPGIWVSMSNNS